MAWIDGRFAYPVSALHGAWHACGSFGGVFGAECVDFYTDVLSSNRNRNRTSLPPDALLPHAWVVQRALSKACHRVNRPPCVLPSFKISIPHLSSARSHLPRFPSPHTNCSLFYHIRHTNIHLWSAQNCNMRPGLASCTFTIGPHFSRLSETWCTTDGWSAAVMGRG